MGRRSARSSRIVTSGLILLAGLLVPLSLNASAEGLEPLGAALQSSPPPDPRTVVNTPTGTIYAGLVGIRVNDQSSVPAFSLDMRKSVSTGQTWSSVATSTPGVGTAAALWTNDHASDTGTPLEDATLEGAARQIEIWAKTGGLSVDSS